MLHFVAITAAFGDSSIVGGNYDDCSHVGKSNLLVISKLKQKFRAFRAAH